MFVFTRNQGVYYQLIINQAILCIILKSFLSKDIKNDVSITLVVIIFWLTLYHNKSLSKLLTGRRRDSALDEEDTEDESPPRQKTSIEQQWETSAGFELTSVEQETYERYFYGTEHWNYFTNDEDLGPVILSIKQETLNSRDQFR